jgi:hypothetical protein
MERHGVRPSSRFPRSIPIRRCDKASRDLEFPPFRRKEFMSKLSPEKARERLDAGLRHANCRNLLVVFGDQLTTDVPAFREFDPNRDLVLMMEVREEAEHVPSHRQRTALFFSAMRHFALELLERSISVRYIRIDYKGYDKSESHRFKDEASSRFNRVATNRFNGIDPNRFAQSLDGEV